MRRLLSHTCRTGATIFGTYVLIIGSNLAGKTAVSARTEEPPTAAERPILEQLEGYSDNSSEERIDVNRFRDVQPTDWAYQALLNLVERYGCIEGYADRTYRDNRSLSRQEFAAGLSSCFAQLERLSASTPGALTREDREQWQRLAREFEAELAALEARVDDLSGRITSLEDRQFSTTTKLNGEVIFGLASAFGDRRATDLDIDLAPPGEGEQEVPLIEEIEGDALNSAVTFTNRVRLNLDSSFTGEDLLRVRLQANNVENLNTGTGMTVLYFGGDNENEIQLSDLYYVFPASDRLELTLIAANDVTFDDFVVALSPFFISSANGALSLLGGYNVLIYPSSDAGIIANYTFSDRLDLYAGYLTLNPNDPAPKGGIFNGDFSALVQLNVGVAENLDVALTYTRTYQPGEEVSLTEGLGSPLGDDPFGGAAASSDRLGATLSWQVAPRVNLGAWFTYQNAEARSSFREGDNAEIITAVATLAILDVGKEGSVLGFIAGVPPKLVAHEGGPEDEDTSVLLEAQYRFPINDNITLTPGGYVVFSPNHNNGNDEIYIGVVRMTFTF